MLNNEAQAASAASLINAVSAANTAAATSSWVDVRRFEGDVEVIINTGAITGSCTPSIEEATDNSGTGGAALVPNEGSFTALTANSTRKYTIRASSTKGFIRFVGTIVTGPSLIAVSYQGRPKNF